MLGSSILLPPVSMCLIFCLVLSLYQFLSDVYHLTEQNCDFLFYSWGSPNICSYLTLFLTIFEVDSFSTILDMVLVILGSSLTEGAWEVIPITTPIIYFSLYRTSPQGMKVDKHILHIQCPLFRVGGLKLFQMFKCSLLYFLLNHLFEAFSIHWFSFYIF